MRKKDWLLSIGLGLAVSALSVGLSGPHINVVKSQPYYRKWVGNGSGAMTSVTAAESTSAATITLTAPSSEITIGATPAGSNVYVNFGGTATTSNFEIPAGYYFTFSGFPAFQTFSIISDGTAGKYSIFAH